MLSIHICLHNSRAAHFSNELRMHGACGYCVTIGYDASIGMQTHMPQQRLCKDLLETCGSN